MLKEIVGLFRRGCGGVALLVLLGTAATGGLAAPASAQDAGALAQQANTELRAAERAMFAGEAATAQQQLDVAAGLIERLKAADPQHRELTGLERKHAKLAADLARRTRKEPPPEQGTEKPPAEAPLPGGVTKRLRDVDAQLERLRSYMAGDSAASPSSRAASARRYVEQAEELLGEIAARYGTQVPADHPALVGARQRVDEAGAEIAAFEARLTAAAAEAAATRPAAEGSPAADRARVQELYEAFADDLDPIHGNSLVYGLQLADAQAALEQLQRVEDEVLPVLQPALAELVARYGETSMAIDHKLHELGVPPRERFATDLERLIEGARNVAASRAASADQIARNVAMMTDGVERIVEHVRVPRLKEQMEILRVGQRLAPNHPEINAMLERLDAQIVAMSAQIERDIDARTWAGPAADFPGPGDLGSLTAAALAYFRGDARWGAHPDRGIEVLAVAIRGPWQVADRDLFGRVVRWRLPIHLAITDAAMKPGGVARVYELSLVGLEGAPGEAEKAPPFDGYWVGDSWAMRIRNLPLDGAR